MPPAPARSGSGNPGRRTNSLAFAKHDCHTCAVLKTDCDRQRPRCGTCLSSRRICDGFAMPLIWKDLEVAQSPVQNGDRRPGQSRLRQSQGDAEFKFVRGRPRRRRKPKSDNLGKLASDQGSSCVERVSSGTNLQESTLTSIESGQDGNNASYHELESLYSRFPDLSYI
jgi:hypothetical protein